MPHETAADLKAQGNKYFHGKYYKEAIESYTKAINKDNRIATYYTNRALCYINVRQAFCSHDTLFIVKSLSGSYNRLPKSH